MSITGDPERLGRVAGQLGEAIRKAEQTRARVRLPMLQAPDAAGLVMAMHAELDDAIDERTAAATAERHHIACSAGCSSCCVAAVLVTEGEAVTVAQWLKLPENAATLAWFKTSYVKWRQALGDSVDKMHRARDDEERRAAAIELKHKNVMCAFNREGLCAVYPARPALCRKAHALETNANCGADGTGEVQYFDHPRTEMTFREQEPMRAALHHSLRPGGNIELLCAAVNRLLAAKSVGRNDPCPCGSGQKYKRCCG